MTGRWLILHTLDYVRVRRRQLNGRIAEDELRGIYGLCEFLIAIFEASGTPHEDCDRLEDQPGAPYSQDWPREASQVPEEA